MADDDVQQEDSAKAEECPKCLPGWFATYSDMVTLLLTFFVLLLSFAKTESSKYEAALGSLREAFGGNVLQQGEVIQKGKSPDDYPTMIESQQPIKPFPIEFLTMEGILDKHEINRASTESLKQMKGDLYNYGLGDMATIYEMPEGIKVKIKDKIFFDKNSLKIKKQGLSVKVFERMVKLISKTKWTIFVEGHAAPGEVIKGGDAFALSSLRAAAVTRSLIRRGIPANRITTVFYGDTRPVKIPGKSAKKIIHLSRRVEFLIRKIDLQTPGHKVD